MAGANPFDSYSEYINSWIWYYKRDAMLQRFGMCKLCNSSQNLVVHHLHYKTLGIETGRDLLVVCKKCHQKIHDGTARDYNFNKTKEMNPDG